MKAITKDYLENTLKSYTTKIVEEKVGAVSEVTELPESPENRVYNVDGKKVYSKDIQLERQAIETTQTDYSSSTPDTGIAYFITDEDSEAITVEQAYDATSENAISGVALKEAIVSAVMDKTSEQTITGTKTFESITIGNCTFSNNSGVLTVS